MTQRSLPKEGLVLDRRELLSTASAIGVLTASGCLSVVAHASPPTERPRRSAGGPAAAAEAPHALSARMAELFDWLDATGWTQLLREVAGTKLSLEDDRLFQDLPADAIRRHPGFEDFGGKRLIQPGDPALSLLYHALASPAVRLEVAGPGAAQSYPAIEQLDLLEDYIYSRQPFSPEEISEDHVLAIFAYEYRPAAKTAHRRHADFAFSRTGISRVGSTAVHYDGETRSFTNGTLGGALTAVLPARYGLFLAKRLTLGIADREFHRIGRERRDGRRDFLLPLRKIYAGDPLIAGAKLVFSESHRNEKLARFASFQGPLVGDRIEFPESAGFDFEKPPFLRVSRTSTGSGASSESELDGELVRILPAGSSGLVTPVPKPLVREALQGKELLRFRVPSERSFKSFKNRRYTTLKVLEAPVSEAQDFVFSDFLFGCGAFTTGLRSPRNAPVFVNIRFEVNEDGSEMRHLDESTPGFFEKVRKGGYWAALFEDSLCDGCVTASFHPPPAGGGATLPPRILDKPVLPAFSIVAAPDLFPLVDPFDYYDHDDHFLEGGPEVVSGGRLRANPNIRLPGETVSAFPAGATDVEGAVADTITALISLIPVDGSAPPAAGAPEARARLDPAARRGSNTLPDTASNVFAPGWDVTYSGQKGAVYYATFGLGSPFPEDMKLCAAANGMWPGSSPDAARTFFGELEPLPGIGLRPPTAVPLLDEELGFHGQSPAVRHYGESATLGWDGEQGPFLAIGSKGEIAVNFADIWTSDYVENALRDRMDVARMRHLTAEILIDRMDALRGCIRSLPGTDTVKRTQHWLISAERVESWAEGARALGVPPDLIGSDTGWIRRARPEIEGPGFLYIFATLQKGQRSIEGAGGRRMRRAKHIHLCQVSRDHVAWVRVGAGESPDMIERSWRAEPYSLRHAKCSIL